MRDYNLWCFVESFMMIDEWDAHARRVMRVFRAGRHAPLNLNRREFQVPIHPTPSWLEETFEEEEHAVAPSVLHLQEDADSDAVDFVVGEVLEREAGAPKVALADLAAQAMLLPHREATMAPRWRRSLRRLG